MGMAMVKNDVVRHFAHCQRNGKTSVKGRIFNSSQNFKNDQGFSKVAKINISITRTSRLTSLSPLAETLMELEDGNATEEAGSEGFDRNLLEGGFALQMCVFVGSLPPPVIIKYACKSLLYAYFPLTKLSYQYRIHQGGPKTMQLSQLRRTHATKAFKFETEITCKEFHENWK